MWNVLILGALFWVCATTASSAEFLWSEVCGVRQRFEKAVGAQIPTSCVGQNSIDEMPDRPCKRLRIDRRFAYQDSNERDFRGKASAAYEMRLALSPACFRQAAGRIRKLVSDRRDVVPTKQAIDVRSFPDSQTIIFYFPLNDLDRAELQRRATNPFYD